MALKSEADLVDYSSFTAEKHIKFCVRFLGVIPQRCQSLDSIRLVIAFFAISSLDLLTALDKLDNKQKIIEWIYSLQIVPSKKCEAQDSGFRGSKLCSLEDGKNYEIYDRAHIAMSYTALCALLILGDDLKRVDRSGIVNNLKELQLPDGSFRPINIECENDMRFIYCAACISYILNDWSGIDKDKAIDYIKGSINYDGGIGQGPGLESHGGSTYCAIATLWLMGELDKVLSKKQLKSLKRWLVFRQQQGFQGRPNKYEDSCYTFWVGATLKLLNCYQFVNYSKLCTFVLSTQDDVTGGIAKWPDYGPDMLHTYLAISGLSLSKSCDWMTSPMTNEDIKSNIDFPSSAVHPALNMSMRAVSYLHEIQKHWDSPSKLAS